MSVFTTSAAHPFVLTRIRRLLVESFGGDFADDDWEHVLGGWHVLLTEHDEPVSHAAVVPRTIDFAGRRFATGYVEGVATAPARQGEGLGALVMNEAARIVRREFDVGALSTGRHRFYERLGWERWQGPTFVRDDDGVVRTEDEDDGIMVLRFGVTRHLDLTGPITCEARSGDDW